MVEGGDGSTDFEIGAGEAAARAGAYSALGTECTTRPPARFIPRERVSRPDSGSENDILLRGNEQRTKRLL